MGRITETRDVAIVAVVTVKVDGETNTSLTLRHGRRKATFI